MPGTCPTRRPAPCRALVARCHLEAESFPPHAPKQSAPSRQVLPNREAAYGPQLQPDLQRSEAPLVSADVVGNRHSSILDAPLTQAVGRQVKVHGWYDK